MRKKFLFIKIVYYLTFYITKKNIRLLVGLYYLKIIRNWHHISLKTKQKKIKNIYTFWI